MYVYELVQEITDFNVTSTQIYRYHISVEGILHVLPGQQLQSYGMVCSLQACLRILP